MKTIRKAVLGLVAAAISLSAIHMLTEEAVTKLRAIHNSGSVQIAAMMIPASNMRWQERKGK